MIYFLVKEKGLKLEAAEEQLRNNASGVNRRQEAIARLRNVRNQLASILSSLNAMR